MSLAHMDETMRQFYGAVSALKGRTAGDPAWSEMLGAIGEAWKTFQISDDDAGALEAYTRSLRFPRK